MSNDEWKTRSPYDDMAEADLLHEVCDRLETELAEARAQAGKHFAETCRLEHELAEARAQIAAKDAALREALHYVEADQNAVAADIEYAIKAALAGETGE